MQRSDRRFCLALRWRRNGHGGVSNHQPHRCLLNRLFGCRSKKTSKLRVTGLCVGNSPGTGEFPAQMASNAENVSIRWRHHGASLNSHSITESPTQTFRSILICDSGIRVRTQISILRKITSAYKLSTVPRVRFVIFYKTGRGYGQQ